MLSIYAFVLILLLEIGMEALEFPFGAFLLISALLFVLTAYITFSDKLFHKPALGLISIGFYSFVNSMLLDFTEWSNWICFLIPFSILVVLYLLRFIRSCYKSRKNGSDLETNVSFF